MSTKASEAIEEERLRSLPTPSPSGWMEYLIGLAIQKYLMAQDQSLRQTSIDIWFARVSAYVRRMDGGQNGKS